MSRFGRSLSGTGGHADIYFRSLRQEFGNWFSGRRIFLRSSGTLFVGFKIGLCFFPKRYQISKLFELNELGGEFPKIAGLIEFVPEFLIVSGLSLGTHQLVLLLWFYLLVLLRWNDFWLIRTMAFLCFANTVSISPFFTDARMMSSKSSTIFLTSAVVYVDIWGLEKITELLG